MKIVENFLELIEIEDIFFTNEYENMVDISVEEDNSFLLSNGIISHNSAVGAFRKYRSAENQGAFALRGKFINAYEINIKKLSENAEVINVMAAIGLKLGQKVKIEDIRYGKILFYVDSDTDGSSIAGLLINFFHKYWPELFDLEMIYKVETPLLVCYNKKNKKKLSFYKQNDYNEWYKNINSNEWDIKYKKGLAALVDDEYNDIINKPLLTLIKNDDFSEENLNIWFGKDAELRKKQILS